VKDVACFKCHKKGHYANKCPKIKATDAKGAFKVRKVDNSSVKEELEAKSIRQIRIRYSDLNAEREDPFIRYWIILTDLGQLRIGPVKDILLKFSWILRLIVTQSVKNFIVSYSTKV